MKQKLRTQLSLGFALIVLLTVALISLASNSLVRGQFEKYVVNKQKTFADGLASGLADQYDAETGEWNLDYIHGFGMYALKDGYIIKIYDMDHAVVWDAEDHDMTYCHQIMNDIQMQMSKRRIDGELITNHYDLEQSGSLIGHVDINYYSPYYSNENEFQFIESLNQILLIVGVASLAGAVMAGAFLAKRIAAPIAKTTEIAKEISEGNYGIRFEAKVGTRELIELTQSVNQMAAALEKQEAIRRRMTMDVAHELRTPIANVSSYLEAIIEGVWEAAPERLQRCYEELSRISELIADLEELGQIENENLKLQFRQVELLELADRVKDSFETALKEKQICCTVEGEALFVLGDKKRLYQVVYNLLSNAVKYTPEGGTICVRIGKEAGMVKLTVRDSGIGISAQELPFVFERFFRADRSRNRRTGGSGIGLSIVKAIVLAHGGTVSVESEVGQGSTFTVVLPSSEHTVNLQKDTRPEL